MRVTGNQQAPRVNADLVSGRLAYAGTVLKETVIRANALVGEKPAGEVAVTVASLAQGETKLSQIALNLSGDLERHGLTLTMKGDPLAADLSLNGSLRGDRWRGALAELKLKTPLKREAEIPHGQLLRQGEPDSPVPGQSGICPERI